MKRYGPELVKINITIEKSAFERMKAILENPKYGGHGASISDFIRRAISFYDVKMVEPNYIKERSASGELKRKKIEENEIIQTLDPLTFAKQELKAITGTMISVQDKFPTQLVPGMKVVIVHGLSNNAKAIPLDKIKQWKEEDETAYSIHMAKVIRVPVDESIVNSWNFENNYGKVELDNY